MATTSVVADLLKFTGDLAKDNITVKVTNLKQKIESTKLELQEILKNRYIDFIPQYVKLDKMASSVHSMASEYEALHYHVEKEMKPQLNTSVTEYHEVIEDLRQIDALKSSVSNLITLQNYLEAIKRFSHQKNYTSAADNVLQFEKLCGEITADLQNNVETFSALKRQLHIHKITLISPLIKYWENNISIVDMEEPNKNKMQIEINLVTDPKEEFMDVIVALKMLGELDSVLKAFGKKLINMVCIPIILKKTEIQFSDKKKNVHIKFVNDAPLPPKIIILHFTKLFTYLHDAFFNWPCTKQNQENKITLMNMLGNIINNEFWNLLIEKCLKMSVPSQSSELQDFQSTIDEAVRFQKFLMELGFFSSQEDPFAVFVKTADLLPASKMSSELLNRSRDLMKKELHKTVVLGSAELSIQETRGESKGLSRASFAFPSCHISESAKDLVSLLRQVMAEAEKLQAQSPSCSLKLVCTARKICELYSCVVPTFHKDNISNIPQLTAIHHNNCMYIAHCLLSLGMTKQTEKMALRVTFVDLAKQLRIIGIDAFLAQMRVQRQHILQLLKDPEAFRSVAQDDNLFSKAEKTVQQCLQQLELLKHVWAEILPVHTYFKSIGTLLNTFIEELISHVTFMEDIAAETAAQLDSIFGGILKQSQELFNVEKRGDERELVHKYVKKWFKFQELQLVLGASLKEIVDRWSSGKGPLASHFTSDEVKHLIRALFQNTERRAAALGKIR